LAHRYARAYGTRMKGILGSAKSLSDLGEHYGDDVYEAEILYMVRYEFATNIEDIIWRRSKMGLHIAPQTKEHIERSLAKMIPMIAQEEGNYAHFARH